MSNKTRETPIRIPVQLVDGVWEYFYGGGLPIEDGAIGSLHVDRHAIQDEEFLASLKRKSSHKILDEGTELLVALTMKSKPKFNENLWKHLIPARERTVMLGGQGRYSSLPPSTNFVKVRIGAPTEKQKQQEPNESGGIWLRLEGMEPKGLTTSKVRLPGDVFSELADSLNHAFTLLSEKYEPWRKSHTGNIYNLIFYRENNGFWYPLDVLRNAAVAKDEHQFIREWWEAISKELGLE